MVFHPSGVWETKFFFSFDCFFVLSMEDLTRSWNKLSLDEREGSRFILKNQLRSSEFILAAKFLTKCVLNMEAMARTFRQLWQSTNGFKIRNLKDHLVLFVYRNQGDIDRILQLEPWCLTSTWWFFKNMTMIFMSAISLSSGPLFGSKYMTFPSDS